GRRLGTRSPRFGPPWTTSNASWPPGMPPSSSRSWIVSGSCESVCDGGGEGGSRSVDGGFAVKSACGREPVVTIDGPAGAGKSTVAQGLARRLGFRLVSTGALYRALAWAVREAGVRSGDERALQAVLDRTTVALVGGRVLVDGRDVTQEIRTPP